MSSTHTAVALLAGTFGWKDEATPTAMTRTADGTPFVEFQVYTTDRRNKLPVRKSHLAVAHGPLALRIATTFDPGDLVVVCGDLRTPVACRFPAVSFDVNNAFRMPAVPMGRNPQGLNVAYVIGTARDATRSRFGDGTPATVLTIACASTLNSQRVSHHTALLEGPERDRARTLGAGDTVRVDGPVGLHIVGQERVWALYCERLRVLERFRERIPLLPPANGSLRRTA
jgi:hypothetical protein